MKSALTLGFVFVLVATATGQDGTYGIFNDRWVINTPSVELLPARKLDVRIAHRFGDFGGDGGGWNTFYGLENAADVSIGFEYGISNNFNIGLSRAKGSGPLKQLVNGYARLGLLRQTPGGVPLSLTAIGMATVSTVERSSDPSSMTYFDVFAHRMVYHSALMAARKFSDRISLQLSAGFTHRNVVPKEDENNLFHAGLALRLQVSKTLAFITDLAVPLNGPQSPLTGDIIKTNYQVPVGVGFEFNTGGHVFQLNFTNATAITPADYLAYTRRDWFEGQFRIGFTISRMFNL